MKVSELSRRAGVSVPTIKYYIREGLLPPGAKDAPNQARYSEDHLQRLKLIRVLREAGGLRIEAIKAVVAALQRQAGFEAIGIVHSALSPGWTTRGGAKPEGWDTAADEVYAALNKWGWDIHRETPTFRYVVDAYLAAKTAWLSEWGSLAFASLRGYAEAAQRIVEYEMSISGIQLPEAPSHETVRGVVLGTVLMEPIILALRRLAQQDQSLKMWRRFRPGESLPGPRSGA